MKKYVEHRLEILSGKPCITGTRIPVSLIVNLLSHHYTPKRIMEAYPMLTEADVYGALEYADRILREEHIDALQSPMHAQNSSQCESFI